MMGSTVTASWLRCACTIVILNYIVPSSTCPPSCQCRPDLHVSCDGQQIPFNIPTNTTSLSLNHLNIETIPADPFQNLTRLRDLTFYEGSIYKLSNISFNSLPYLETLRLMGNKMKFIETNAFGPLINLKKLKITDSPDIGLTKMGDALYGLRKSQLRVLDLNAINRGTQQEFTLYPSFYRFLEKLPIESISISRNNILMFKPGFSKYIKNVKNFTISRNYLIGYIGAIEEVFLGSLPDLILVDISDQRKLRYTRASESQKNDLTMLTNWIYLRLPKNLTFLYLGAMNVRMSKLDSTLYCPNCKYLDGSRSIINDLIRLDGLQTLEVLNLQNCDINHISYTFFSTFKSLKTALLGINNIGNIIHGDKKGKLFRGNTHLEVLDIANTGLVFLPTQFLSAIYNIRILNVSKNFLSDLNQFKILKTLEILQIANNQVYKIETSTINWLENKGANLQIDISENPITEVIHCCDIKDFIIWTKQTRVLLIKNETFKCFTNETVLFSNLTLKSLEKICPETEIIHIAPILAMSLLSFTLIVMVIPALIYRYRHKWMWWYTLIKGYVKVKREFVTDANCTYDAFVAYAGEDVTWIRNELIPNLENKRGFRLCIHQRDFNIGRPIIENIVNNIQKSRHVILILSRWFLQSEWCEFELVMATNKERETHNDIIIPILLEDVDRQRTSDVVNNVLTSTTFTTWPTQRDLKAIFWQRLVDTMGTPISEDRSIVP